MSTLMRLYAESFSWKKSVLAAMTTRIAPTLYVGYAMYALTLDNDLSRKRLFRFFLFLRLS